MNLRTIIAVGFMIILVAFISLGLLPGQSEVVHEESEADKIRNGCKATVMYTIDSYEVVRRVYDCGEKG